MSNFPTLIRLRIIIILISNNIAPTHLEHVSKRLSEVFPDSLDLGSPHASHNTGGVSGVVSHHVNLMDLIKIRGLPTL